MTFQERAKLGIYGLSKQPPVTLEMAREQVRLLNIKSKCIKKKRKN